MLDFLRRSSTSVFAWIILGLLVVVFAFSFGLPGDGCSSSQTAAIVNVYNTPIAENEFRVQYKTLGLLIQIPPEPQLQQMLGIKEEALESAVEREVLARAGTDMGLEMTIKDAEDLIGKGLWVVLGQTDDWMRRLGLPDDYGFDYETFTDTFLRTLQMTEQDFLETQRRELLAQVVRDAVQATTIVSEAELRQRYDESANKLSLRYAQFDAADFAPLVDPSDEAIDSWVQTHRDELAAEVDRQGGRFLKLAPQKRVHLIALDKTPSSEGSEPVEGDSAPDPQAALEAAKARIDEGTDFRTVAREVSVHDTRKAGGSLGWVNVKAGTAIDPVVDQAIRELEDGMSDVLEGDTQLYLVRVSGSRQGDTPQDEAMRELAYEAVQAAEGQRLAQQAAREALDALQGGKPPEEVFGPASPHNIELRETGWFSKSEPVPVLGESDEIIDAVWSEEPSEGLLPQLFTVDGGVALVGLAQKEEGSKAGYLSERDTLLEQMRAEKAARMVGEFANWRCKDAKLRGEIAATPEKVERVMTYQVPESATLPAKEPYEVCSRVGRILQTGMGG